MFKFLSRIKNLKQNKDKPKKVWVSNEGMRVRFLWILLAFMLGINIVLYFHELSPEYLLGFELLKGESYDNLKNSIQFLLFLLGLPLFVVLWIFRTYDNNHREFFEAVGILGEENRERTGLILLMQLRNGKKVFREKIDNITSGSKFPDIRLSNLDLREINLSNSELTFADFTGADLRGAVFIKSNLRNAKLIRARLEGADFRGVLLENVYLKEATYSSKTTQFNDGFDEKILSPDLNNLSFHL